MDALNEPLRCYAKSRWSNECVKRPKKLIGWRHQKESCLIMEYHGHLNDYDILDGYQLVCYPTTWGPRDRNR